MQKTSIALVFVTTMGASVDAQPLIPAAAPATDLNKPVSITLNTLQRIIDAATVAATARAQAECALKTVQPDLQDLIKQATSGRK